MKTKKKLTISISAVLMTVVMLLTMMSAGIFGVTAATGDVITDNLANFDKTSAHSDGWEYAASHAFAGVPTLGKATVQGTEEYITYTAPEGKTFSDFTLGVLGQDLNMSAPYVPMNSTVLVKCIGQADFAAIAVDVTDGAAVGETGYSTYEVTPKNELNAVEEIKFVINSGSVNYTIYFTDVSLTEGEASSYSISDDLSTYDKTNTHSDGWIRTTDADTGLDVLKKVAGDGTEEYVTYLVEDGFYFSDFTLKILANDGYCNQAYSIVFANVAVRLEGESTFSEPIELAPSEAIATGTDGYSFYEISPKSDIGKVVEIKFLLTAGSINWVVQLVSIDLTASAVAVEPPAPTGGKLPLEWTSFPNLPAAPDKAGLFLSDMMEEVGAYWSDYSGEWQAFGANAQFEYPDDDTKCGIGKMSQDMQYFTYEKGKNGVADKYITNFELDCSLSGMTFWGDWLPTPYKEGDMKVYYRLEGSEEFVALEVGHTDLGDTNDSDLLFATFRPMAALPDKVVELKFEMSNQWGYGIYLHQARLYGAANTENPDNNGGSKDPDNNGGSDGSTDNVKAGIEDSIVVAITIVVSAMLAGGTVLFIKRRRLCK